MSEVGRESDVDDKVPMIIFHSSVGLIIGGNGSWSFALEPGVMAECYG